MKQQYKSTVITHFKLIRNSLITNVITIDILSSYKRSPIVRYKDSFYGLKE